MKKIVKIGLIVVPVLIIVFLVVFFFSLNSIIKAAVETVGPKVTGTSVTLDSVKISPFSGRGALKGFRVGNPEGFKAESAFELAEVSVSMDVKSMMSDTVVIREVLIDGPEITFEGSLSGSNIGKMRGNVEAFSRSGGPDKAVEPQAGGQRESGKKEGGKKVIIDRLVLRNGKVGLAATMLTGEGVTIPLPDIELTDIGRESNGATLEQVMEEVVPQVYEAITEAVAGSGELVEQGIEMLEDSARTIGGAAQESATKALKDLEGIFKR